MPDVTTLADWGGAALDAVWLPVAVWTAVALAVEGALRLARAEAAVGLPVRGAALAALPLAVAVPAALTAWAPETAATLTAFAPPAVSWLPEVVVGGGAAPVVVEPAPPAGLVVLGALTALAALVGAVALVRLAGGAVRLAHARQRLPPAPPAVAAALDAARRRAGVGRPVRAVEAPPGAAPFTVGWRRPVVAVPADLGGAALDVALAHEVAHVRRADFAWQAAQRAVVAAFAAHPLARVLSHGLDLDRERAADAAVLAARPDARRAYADLLLRYASLPAPPFALGAGRGDLSLKTRIEAMKYPLSLDRTRRLARRGRLAGLLTLALAAGLAATTAPGASASPSADATSVLPTLSDSTAAAVESVEVQDQGAVTTVTVTLKAGYGRATAEAVAAEASFPPGDHRLVVRYEGGVVRRAVRFDGTPTQLEAAPFPRPPAPPDTTDEVYEVAEVQPELIGGLAGLQQNVTYPESARAEDVEGQVVVQFVVDEQGGVVDPVVLRSPDDRLSEAAISAVRQARFRPGQQRGEAVRVRFAVPITFRLDGEAAPPRPARSFRAGPETTDDGTPIFEVAEVQPRLIGGLAELQERVVYPADARAEGVEGQVVVQFVIDEGGAVVDPVVLRSPDDRLAEAALAAVRQARFEPGMQRGEPVKVRFAVPITFRLPAGDGIDRGARTGGDNGPAVLYDVSYSDDLERLVDHRASMTSRSRATMMARVAAGEPQFRDLRPGTARLRFRVQEGGRMLILGDVEADSDALARFARFHALATEFEPQAAQREGEMVLEVSQVR